MAKNNKVDTSLTTAKFESASLVDKLDVTGFEESVKAVRTKTEQLDKLSKEIQDIKNVIVFDAQNRRTSEEAKGNFYKTLVYKNVEGGDPAKVVFTNAYKPIDITNEPKMKEQLGAAFDVFFKKTSETRLKADADLNQLKVLLGEEKFNKFFDTINCIKFQDEFMEKRAEQRKTLNKKVNNVLEDYQNQMQAAPQFRLK